MSSYRYDAGQLGKARLDHTGNLIVNGTLTRTGVFEYRRADGSVRRELRHPDEVFSEASLESAVQAPVTLGHPPKPVTPDTFRNYAVGNTGDTVKTDGQTLSAMLTIRDAGAIAAVLGKGGKPVRELSCGYTADVIEEPGSWNGERYDLRQVNIRYNHVAIVQRGRAGRVARLHIDADDAVQVVEQDRVDDFNSSPADAAAERAHALDVARRLGIATEDTQALSDIHRACIRKARPELDLSNVSDDYLKGAFKGVAAKLKEKDVRNMQTTRAPQGDRLDLDDLSPRQRMLREVPTAHLDLEDPKQARERERLLDVYDRQHRPLPTNAAFPGERGRQVEPTVREDGLAVANAAYKGMAPEALREGLVSIRGHLLDTKAGRWLTDAEEADLLAGND
jgi:hypothetical protein